MNNTYPKIIDLQVRKASFNGKKLFPMKFEEMLERPIQDVRKELNITPVREGPSWYQNPKLNDAGLS